MRSPGARKSAAGPNGFSVLITGGYDRSVRSTATQQDKKTIKINQSDAHFHASGFDYAIAENSVSLKQSVKNGNGKL